VSTPHNVNRRATRILLVTDSAALPTGLAETTRLIFNSLLRAYPDAYELSQVGFFHCYAVTQPPWPIRPTKTAQAKGGIRFSEDDLYGEKTVPEVVRHWRPDIVFGFGDPQRLLHLCIPADGREHRVILYLNFDGLPLPPGWAPQLSRADAIVTKSDFSRRVLLDSLGTAAPKRVSFLYSPADTERFKPISKAEKQELRSNLLPEWMPQDAFILGWNGRNQWRKQVWLLYKVLHYLRHGDYFVCSDCGRITPGDWNPCPRDKAREGESPSEQRPGYKFEYCDFCKSERFAKADRLENIFLWNHMPDPEEGDWSCRELERQFGVHANRDIFYTEGYALKSSLGPEAMPILYQLWDCLLYLSGGEGFGLPAWEAMCAGVPVIYTNYSSHAEFLGRAGAGIPVGGILQPEAKQCIWRMIGDVGQTIGAVRRLYFERGLAERFGQNGHAFVQEYSTEIQVKKWHEIFQGL
jgi:glycosyltransferase involved in cell wall biosynthesis